ncbi:P-loop containing nucleoside triphosphate hydrolase protein [Favolaschia claudopus]|uniref:P-loop containing nucleoside triphosphate hydrolase protein n=1 Tax=Favolaschia claudopus TaxID=2862362 RepID=A0AAW0BBU8_9AGAR
MSHGIPARTLHGSSFTLCRHRLALRQRSKRCDFDQNLSDLDKIRDAIAAAQDKILGPSPTDAPTPGSRTHTFSENCVSVVARGPNMHDLYFYDIPGVIHEVADGEDPAQIDLIKRLVKKYVSKPDCIVLLVMSCGHDPEIGGVAPLIFDSAEPNSDIRSRTVGVLTKVDKIEPELEQRWLKMFDNEIRRLDHGWFAVKLPAGNDVSWEEARSDERDYFAEHQPWMSLPRANKDRLGSEQLARYISKLLSNLVADRLPAISQEFGTKIDDCEASLDKMPHFDEQVAHDTIVAAIDSFSAQFSRHIQGIPPRPFSRDVGLVFKVKQLYRTIEDGVSKHTPRFCPDMSPTRGSAAGSSSAWAQITATGEIVYIDQMMEHIKLSITRELPGELPYGIVPKIITYYVENWQNAALGVFREVKQLTVEHFRELVQQHFFEYELGGFLRDILNMLEDNITQCANRTVAELKGMAAMEMVPATIMQSDYLVLQTAIRRHYQSSPGDTESSLWSFAANILGVFLAANPNMCTGIEANVVGDFLVKNALRLGTQIAQGLTADETQTNFQSQLTGIFGLDSSSVDRLTAGRERNNALEVMASAQAYLQLAAKRFADEAAGCIDHFFLRKLDDGVRNALRLLPANTSPEICLRLVQDPQAEQRRMHMVEKRDRYTTVKRAVDKARRELAGDTADLATENSLPIYSPLTMDYSDGGFGSIVDSSVDE